MRHHKKLSLRNSLATVYAIHSFSCQPKKNRNTSQCTAEWVEWYIYIHNIVQREISISQQWKCPWSSVYCGYSPMWGLSINGQHFYQLLVIAFTTTPNYFHDYRNLFSLKWLQHAFLWNQARPSWIYIENSGMRKCSTDTGHGPAQQTALF